ncbi:MAG TPA: glucose 1-dehydrogenase [Segeticoccus sp.]|nr:glucose 1-dehydrogenase [Segeticoccus sp.]
MRALTLEPKSPGSLAVTEVPDPESSEGLLLVDGLAVGVCGTDKELAAGEYGWAPPGRDRLVIGHESLGRVREAPDGSGFAPGDLVAGVVRRPDPVPCGACAHGQFDMCRNGRYTERGIKELDGFASEAWVLEPDYAIKLDPGLSEVGMLMEPTSVVAKAWDQVEKIGSRAWFDPKSVLVTGAGPIGLLAALLGAQRGLDVHVLDIVTDGPKPQLVADLGGTYHHDGIAAATKDCEPDVIIECTGVGQLVFEAMAANASYGLVCLTGISGIGRSIPVDAGQLNREIVLQNDAVFGSVNANVDHWMAAAGALGRADTDWLRRLVSRRVPLEEFEQAFAAEDEDVKVVLTLGD